MSEFSPLLAFDIGELIPVVIFIIIALISLVGNILKAGQKKPPGGGAPRPARQPGKKPAGEELVDEIGEFLRKAANQGRGQQGQQGQRAQQGQGGQAGPPARQPRPRPVRAEMGRAEMGRGEPVEAQVVDDLAPGDEIERHVGQYLEKERLSRQASQLGREVSAADKKADQRLQQVFGHDVSRLAKRPGKTARETLAEQPETPDDRTTELPSTAAAGLAALFSNAESIRQAIIINEVLTRPEDRWT